MPASPTQQPDAAAKVLVFLKGRHANRGRMRQSLQRFANDAATGHPAWEVWEALPSGLLGDSPQGQAGPGLDFDFVLESAAPDGGDAIAGLAELDDVDAGQSALFVGTEYRIVSGRGDAALFCPLMRQAHLSAADFQNYWLNVHAEYGRKDPHNGYCQVHPAAPFHAGDAGLAGLKAAAIDGVAEAFFKDVPTMVARLNSPAVAGEAYADEQRFIDHSRSSFLPFERIRA